MSDTGKKIKKLRQKRELTQKNIAEILDVSTSYIGQVERGKCGLSEEKIKKLEEIFTEKIIVSEVDDWIDIPLMSVSSAAGTGYLNYQEKQVDTIKLPKSVIGSNHSKHAIKVAGDSMSPTIKDGDLVIIDLSDTEIRESKIYVFCTQYGCLIKRLKPTTQGIEIYSDNPAFNREITDPDKIRVIGRVIHSICNF